MAARTLPKTSPEGNRLERGVAVHHQDAAALGVISPALPRGPNDRLTVLCLDLGQRIGWALRGSDGQITSGVPVGTIKRHVTGKGSASKEAVIAAVRALGHDPVDDNEADALALLHWALVHRIDGFGATVAPVAPRKRGERQ
jgi:hypothetical protein